VQTLQVCEVAQRAVPAKEASPLAQRRTAEDIWHYYLQGQSPRGQRIWIAYLRGYVAGATAPAKPPAAHPLGARFHRRADDSLRLGKQCRIDRHARGGGILVDLVGPRCADDCRRDVGFAQYPSERELSDA
jgi:hypothetical protein